MKGQGQSAKSEDTGAKNGRKSPAGRTLDSTLWGIKRRASEHKPLRKAMPADLSLAPTWLPVGLWGSA